MTDDQNRPIKPFNFHHQTRFKSETDRDLYRFFMTSLDGTPMPSFADNVNPEEAWELVFNLRTLQPMATPEKQIAKQLGLRQINPDAPAPARRNRKRSRRPQTNEPKPQGTENQQPEKALCEIKTGIEQSQS